MECNAYIAAIDELSEWSKVTDFIRDAHELGYEVARVDEWTLHKLVFRKCLCVVEKQLTLTL